MEPKSGMQEQVSRMVNALGIIEARPGSDPLKGLVARRLGGKPLLEWVVRRMTDCQRLDRVIVLTGRGPEEQFVSELAPPDVPVFGGPVNDVLARYEAALDAYPARAVVRVGADSPFIDPVLVDRLVNTADEHPECDYIGYRRADGRPALLAPMGLFAEWCRADALRRAAREAARPVDRQQPTRYLYSHPESFTVRLIPAPAGLDRDDVRLTVEFEEDWEHAQTIYEALGPDALDWQRIAGLLEQQPALRSRMAVLNRRQEQAS
jgi:spore coat polysaccharide biosynthesis protein SpsF